MQTGISTASLFARKVTEQALEFLDKSNIQTAEVFLESYCEYEPSFASVLNAVKKNISVHSVHTLTTQFEPQLYSINERAQKDSFDLLEKTMTTAELIGAKYYTFHGGARVKRTPFKIDYDRVGGLTQRIIDVCKTHGVTLTYENVHWGYYNYIGFFKELKKRTQGLKATLDIKQARQSGLPYSEYIEDMGEDIVTVHLSDVDENGKMCLPGKGVTDFSDLFSRLKGKGFDGALIIEAYPNDYGDESELFNSLDFIQEVYEKTK